VMKEKKELLTNFNFFSIPTVEMLQEMLEEEMLEEEMLEMLQEEIQSLCNFSFLEIVKIEPANKVLSFFSARDPFSARKTSFFISFTSLIGME
jgi:hypothetical protein